MGTRRAGRVFPGRCLGLAWPARQLGFSFCPGQLDRKQQGKLRRDAIRQNSLYSFGFLPFRPGTDHRAGFFEAASDTNTRYNLIPGYSDCHELLIWLVLLDRIGLRIFTFRFKPRDQGVRRRARLWLVLSQSEAHSIGRLSRLSGKEGPELVSQRLAGVFLDAGQHGNGYNHSRHV